MSRLIDRSIALAIAASMAFASVLLVSAVKDAAAQCPPTGCTIHWTGAGCDDGCDPANDICCWP